MTINPLSGVRSATFCALLALVIALWSGSFAYAAGYATDRFYVVVPDSVRPLSITEDSLGQMITGYDCLDSLNAANGYNGFYKSFHHPRHDSDGIYTVCFPDTVDLDSVLAAYDNAGCFELLSKIVSFESTATPNDPLFDADTAQWGLDEYHSRVNQVWEMTSGDSNLVIAIIDEGGFFWEHPDLINSVWINAGEDINGNGTFEPWDATIDSAGVTGDLNDYDDDSNGYNDDVIGLRFGATVNSPFADTRLFGWHTAQSEPDTAYQHGTACASIAGGTTNNAEGMSGVAGGWYPARGPRIMGIVTSTNNADQVLNGVEYAIDAGADIISMSFVTQGGTGGWGVDSLNLKRFDELLYDAFEYHDMIIVAAAGNDGDSVVNFPAAFGHVLGFHTPGYPNDKRVIGVGSLNYDNEKCVSSTYGNNLYDVAAPGHTWWAQVRGESDKLDSLVYSYNIDACATSWACPTVAGTMALMKSLFPEQQNWQLVQRMFDAADTISNASFKFGSLDAFQAIVNWPHWEEGGWGLPGVTGQTIRLYGDVVVPPGDTLVIHPGADVLLCDNDFSKGGSDSLDIEIVVNGVLIARGTNDSVITFEADPAQGTATWLGIRVGDGGRAVLENVEIRDAYCGIEFENTGTSSITTCLIENCEMYGIYTASDSLSIYGSVIRDVHEGYGIRAANCDIDIVRDTIYRCAYGIYQTGAMDEGTIYRTKIGYDEDTIGIRGMTVQADLDITQCGFYGGYSDAALYALVLANDIDVRGCGFFGDTLGTVGLFADNFSRVDIRCTDFGRYSSRRVYGHKADVSMGDLSGGDNGRNRFLYMDSAAGTLIESYIISIKAEMNWYSETPDSSNFEGNVDWNPYYVYMDSTFTCVYCSCDTTVPPDTGAQQSKIAAQEGVADEFQLSQNYPNPFNPSTVIQYSIEREMHVTITVFNILGQEVITLVDAQQVAGPHRVTWNGRDRKNRPVPSGLYLYQLVTDEAVRSKKMVVLR